MEHCSGPLHRSSTAASVAVEKCWGESARQSVSRVLSATRATRRPFLWDAFCNAPHATNPDDGTGMPLRSSRIVISDIAAVPIRSCSRWGLPCRPCCQERGALLPHRFALACGVRPEGRPCAGGLFSVALSLGSPPPAVSRHRIPVEPGLSSVCGMTRRQRSSDCLAEEMCAGPGYRSRPCR